MKACYGHTEGAAGIHGAMLAVLAVQRRGVPAIMHSRTLNPYVQAALEDWQASCNVSASIPKVISPRSSAELGYRCSPCRVVDSTCTATIGPPL